MNSLNHLGCEFPKQINHAHGYCGARAPCHCSNPICRNKARVRIRIKSLREKRMAGYLQQKRAQPNHHHQSQSAPSEPRGNSRRTIHHQKNAARKFYQHRNSHDGSDPPRVELLVLRKGLAAHLAHEWIMHHLNKPNQAHEIERSGGLNKKKRHGNGVGQMMRFRLN